MRRGDVWWAELDGEAGFRPVVIISRSDALARRRNITIAEVTRVVRLIPSEVPLTTSDGMPTDCVVNADNIHTIPKDRLRREIMSLSAEKLFALNSALQYSLDIGH